MKEGQSNGAPASITPGAQARPEPSPSPAPLDFLTGGGEMGSRVRAFDWAATALGPVEAWPQSLRSAVSILLPSKAQVVLFWGPDLIAIYNDAYRPAFGTKHPWALGRPARECWREVWDVLQPLFEGVMRTGEAFWAQDHIFYLERHGYPEETYFDVSYDPVRDESGRVGGVFCIVSETTGRVLGERRLRTLRELALESMVSSDAQLCTEAAAILARNPNDVPFALFYLLEPNGASAELVATTTGIESARAGPAGSVHLASNTPAAAGVRQAVRTGKAVEAPPGAFLEAVPGVGATDRCLVIPLISGTEAAGALVAGISRHLALSGHYRDFFDLLASRIATAIANRRAYDQERKRAEALLELDRAKTVFFSNVSHEFRTPLTLMIGPLEEALSKPDRLSGEMRDQLEVAHRSSLRLLKLVNTLLDFSRIEAGRIQATYEPTDLAALTAELASVFRSALEKAGLRLVVDCPPLPEPVYVDREMWEKIVLNLVSNAFKFTFEGAVTVALQWCGDRVELCVRDTGIGIPESELAHVFERFHRVRGAQARTHEGTGIGLALVQELVRLHGGEVAVQSLEGRGSNFLVSIPTGTAHLPPDRIGGTRQREDSLANTRLFVDEARRWLPGPEPSSAVESEPVLDPGDSGQLSTRPDPASARSRVLIVDDNADLRDYLQRLLAPAYCVQTAVDGQAALESIERELPDLVLSDIMLPRLDGFALLRHLRSHDRTRSLPVILLSARAGEEARVVGLSAGADDYLIKPFSARELLARVDAHLKLSQMRVRLHQEHAALANLFHQSPLPMAVVRGPELIFEMANQAYLQVLGGRELLGKPLLEAVPEVKGQGYDELLRRVMQTGVPEVRCEACVKLKQCPTSEPEETYWTFIYAPLYDAQGRPGRVIAICNEVTEQVRARQKLEHLAERLARELAERRRAEEALRLYQEIFTAAQDGIAIVSPEGFYLEQNPAHATLLGYSDAELQGKTPAIHLGEATATIVFEALQKEGLWRGEAVSRTKSGREVPVELSAFSVKDDQGRALCHVGVKRDISDRKRAEQALAKRAKEQAVLYRFTDRLHRATSLTEIYEAALDAMLSALECQRASILICDEAGTMRFAGWRGLSDTYRQAVEGHSPWKPGEHDPPPVCVDDVELAPLPAPLNQIVLQEGIRALAFFPMVVNGCLIGKFMACYDAPHPFTDQDRNLGLTVAHQLAFGIEHERGAERLEQAVQERTASLREAVQQMEEFSYTVSHDLRAPLRAMHGYSQALLDDFAPLLPDEARHYLTRLSENANRLDRMILDVLTFSRIARAELCLETIWLDRLVRDLVEQYPNLKPPNTELRINCRHAVLGHEPSLTQALSNLLDNAVKFVRPGVTPRIYLWTEPRDRAIRLWVEDNGIGVDPRYQHRLFKIFERVHANLKYDGTGVGLAIVRKAVERMGGNVGLVSNGTDGSRFWIDLRAAPTEL